MGWRSSESRPTNDKKRIRRLDPQPPFAQSVIQWTRPSERCLQIHGREGARAGSNRRLHARDRLPPIVDTQDIDIGGVMRFGPIAVWRCVLGVGYASHLPRHAVI